MLDLLLLSLLVYISPCNGVEYRFTDRPMGSDSVERMPPFLFTEDSTFEASWRTPNVSSAVVLCPVSSQSLVTKDLDPYERCNQKMWQSWGCLMSCSGRHTPDNKHPRKPTELRCSGHKTSVVVVPLAFLCSPVKRVQPFHGTFRLTDGQNNLDTARQPLPIFFSVMTGVSLILTLFYSFSAPTFWRPGKHCPLNPYGQFAIFSTFMVISGIGWMVPFWTMAEGIPVSSSVRDAHFGLFWIGDGVLLFLPSAFYAYVTKRIWIAFFSVFLWFLSPQWEYQTSPPQFSFFGWAVFGAWVPCVLDLAWTLVKNNTVFYEGMYDRSDNEQHYGRSRKIMRIVSAVIFVILLCVPVPLRIFLPLVAFEWSLRNSWKLVVIEYTLYLVLFPIFLGFQKFLPRDPYQVYTDVVNLSSNSETSSDVEDQLELMFREPGTLSLHPLTPSPFPPPLPPPSPP